MNSIILSHTSALKALRLKRIGTIESEISTLVNNHFEQLHILVKSKTKQHSSKRFKHHLQQQSLPKNSFINISNGIQCARAELMMIQLASCLSFEKLSLLVLEFCGSFAINSTTGTFDKDLLPETNIKTIKKYVDEFKTLNPHAHGLKKITEVLDVCDNGSASPMESRLFIKLAGPTKYGMYGCKSLKFNNTINLSKKAAKIAGQSTIKPDICNTRYKVAIEYDSAQFHTETLQNQTDKRRRDALANDG